jgi:predicted porin
MKKSLIALAVAGAFAAPTAAMAVDVSFGGEFDLFLESFDNGDESIGQMNNTHSRFWWDMVDDLGTGLKVKGHLELDVGAVGYHGGNAANSSATTVCTDAACTPGSQASVQPGVNNRNSYIGLAGDSWGEVRFGTQENILEATGYAVDPFHGAAGPGGNIVNGMGQSGDISASAVFNGSNIGARRTDSTITYISPNWKGLTFQVDYALAGPTGTGRTSGSEDWTELYYGARYDGQANFGGWRVYGAGGQIDNADLSGTGGGPGTSSKDSEYRLGGGITWGNFAVDAIYESNEWDSTDSGGAKIKRDGWWLGGSWMIPTGKVALGYIMMNDREVNGSDVSSSDTTNIAIGYYHTLSANSSLYAIYNGMDNGDNAAGNIQSGGTAALGKDPSTIGVGMYLVF